MSDHNKSETVVEIWAACPTWQVEGQEVHDTAIDRIIADGMTFAQIWEQLIG